MSQTKSLGQVAYENYVKYSNNAVYPIWAGLSKREKLVWHEVVKGVLAELITHQHIDLLEREEINGRRDDEPEVK